MSSLDSVKGPSITVNLPSARRTRFPLALGCSPSVESITPALVISSTNAPMRSISCRFGGVPASELASALSMPSIFMVVSPDGWPAARARCVMISHNIERWTGSAKSPERRLPRSTLCDLLPQSAVMIDRRALAEVYQLEHLADLDLAVLFVGIGAAPDPFDRLCERFALQDPVAGDQLLGLRERPVNHRALVAREPDTRPFRARL